MNIMTWNIYSVLLRAELVVKASDILKPDVICLQETKTPDEFFPHDVFEKAGFTHRHINGMKGYNGVAILSKIPFSDPKILNRVGKTDCRHIAVTFPNFELHNLYIPAGGDVPDRNENEKFGHKLDFVDELARFFSDDYTSQDSLMAVGDFNIAPYEHDVWSHKQLLDVVSHTPIEVDGLNRFYGGLNWVDTARHFIPKTDKHYTWWSYRNRDWKASNRGRRLDHIWVTQPLQNRLMDYKTLPIARDWDKTSDHIPVMISLT